MFMKFEGINKNEMHIAQNSCSHTLKPWKEIGFVDLPLNICIRFFPFKFHKHYMNGQSFLMYNFEFKL